MNIFRKSALGAALAATALASASPALARDHHGNRNGDTAAAAIAGGIIGIALGAIIASSGDKDRDRYREGYDYDRDGRYYQRDGRWHERRDRRWDDRDSNRYYERRGYRDGGYYRGY